jgi:2-haloacid dehalogenase
VGEPEVLLFDLYGTLVDPLSVDTELGRLFGDSAGRDLARLWRAKQVDYSFRLTLMGQYRDFRWVTARAFDDAVSALGLSIRPTEFTTPADLYDHLPTFPDTSSGLQTLKRDGHLLAVLSNGTGSMIGSCLANHDLRDVFSVLISADDVGAYKPSGLVYRYAAKILGRPIAELRLISSNPFDVIGAKTAGMRTAWINRAGTSFDSIGAPPDITTASLTDLREVLRGRQTPTPNRAQ